MEARIQQNRKILLLKISGGESFQIERELNFGGCHWGIDPVRERLKPSVNSQKKINLHVVSKQKKKTSIFINFHEGLGMCQTDQLCRARNKLFCSGASWRLIQKFWLADLNFQSPFFSDVFFLHSIFLMTMYTHNLRHSPTFTYK